MQPADTFPHDHTSKPFKLTEPDSLPSWSLEALRADANLPVCSACGTQYPRPSD